MQRARKLKTVHTMRSTCHFNLGVAPNDVAVSVGEGSIPDESSPRPNTPRGKKPASSYHHVLGNLDFMFCCPHRKLHTQSRKNQSPSFLRCWVVVLQTTQRTGEERLHWIRLPPHRLAEHQY